MSKLVTSRKLTLGELRTIETFSDAPVEAFEWFLGTMPTRSFVTSDLYGTSWGVPRGRWKTKDWRAFADSEIDEEGYDFDRLRFPITEPIIVSVEGGPHLHIWDGWHRATLAVTNAKSQPTVPVYVGFLKQGIEKETGS
jgi:hypothetical protein